MIKELFKFSEIKLIDSVVNTIEINTFTSSKSESIVYPFTYSPVAMSRSDSIQKSETSKSNMKISFSAENTFARKWINKNDSMLRVKLYEDNGSTIVVTWHGRLVSTESNGKHIVLNFESIFSSLRNYGLRRVIQRSCNHTLFSTECGLLRSTYATGGTISVMGDLGDNRVLTVGNASSEVDDYFTYGTIVDASGNGRMIDSHTGSTIIMAKRCDAFETEFDESGSVSVTLYPGCTKSRDVCHTKYDNVINFGGFPYLPIKDFFDKITVI